MSFLTSIYSLGNIMDGVDIDNLTIEQYLRLTQESQTPKKIEDITIAEYLEYEKKVNENHISDTKSYLPTYFGKSTPTPDPIREFSHYFGPNQPGAESDCDLEDMEEEVEYITDDEVGVENMKDALISIIKSIRQEMKDDIMKRRFEASTASDEIAGPNSLSPGKRGLVKRWHVCKPIHEPMMMEVVKIVGCGRHVTLTQNSALDECEMEFMDINDFLQIRYGQHKIYDTIQERRIGHNNLHESDREFIFNEWILDSYDVKEEYAREIGGRSFICITDREDEALPLERVHGARFKAMIRKELEGNKYVHENPEAMRQLLRPARLIIM
ncbi:hypothetical protein Tco_0436743, partial [Tanacetum coccineum]